jgi:hypothetical protein
LVIEPDSESIALKVLLEKRIPDLLKEYGKNITLQGELIGPGIQMNGLKEYQWRVPSFHPFHSSITPLSLLTTSLRHITSSLHHITSPPLLHNSYDMQSLRHAIFTPRNLYTTMFFYPLLVVQDDFPLNY